MVYFSVWSHITICIKLSLPGVAYGNREVPYIGRSPAIVTS